MTEHQKYRNIKRIGDVEIREYLPCVMADVVVQSEYKNAGNIGFRPLVTYISENKIAMTAPVIQERKDEKSWIVSFVMPADKELKDLPIPKNSKVSLRHSPNHFAAAITFSGITTWDKVNSKERELLSILETNNIKTIGKVQIARFDPPWKPGFMRHNEVSIQIDYPAKSTPK